MEINKKKNSSNSLVFGRWPQTKMQKHQELIGFKPEQTVLPSFDQRNGDVSGPLLQLLRREHFENGGVEVVVVIPVESEGTLERRSGTKYRS